MVNKIITQETEAELEAEILAKQFKDTFSTADGKEVLAHILNFCGYFATDVSYIVPSNIAIANKILQTIGTTSPENIAKFVGSMLEVKGVNE
jgi:hypothetical protein